MDENTGKSKWDKFPPDDKEMGSARICLQFGGVKTKNRHKEWSAEERYELVAKVLAGKSIKSVAFSVAIDDGMLSSVLTNTKQRGKNHPTRVGTRLRSRRIWSGFWDHPHACGDKTLGKATDTYHKGSSPRVWGQANSICTKFGKGRIIPTRVGTSGDSLYAIIVHQDHPHAYGDKWHIGHKRKRHKGSSPRVWGQWFYRLSMMIA